jgi:hypothetical protein
MKNKQNYIILNVNYIFNILSSLNLSVSRDSYIKLEYIVNQALFIIEENSLLKLSTLENNSSFLNYMPEQLSEIKSYITDNKKDKCLIDYIFELIEGTLKPDNITEKWDTDLAQLKLYINDHQSILRNTNTFS